MISLYLYSMSLDVWCVVIYVKSTRRFSSMALAGKLCFGKSGGEVEDRLWVYLGNLGASQIRPALLKAGVLISSEGGGR